MDSAKDLKYATLPNNETYAYRTQGSSKDILLLIHGNLSSSYYYYSTVMPLLSKTFKVIAPDLRGYGHSSFNKPQSSVDDLVEDIKLFVDYLKLEKFSLVGWSLGGGIAMKYAAKYPDSLEKLILLHSIGIYGLPVYLESKDTDEKVRAKTLEQINQMPGILEIDQAFKEQNRDKIESLLMDRFFTGSKKPSKEKLEGFVSETLLQKSYCGAKHILNAFNISDEDNGVTKGTNEIKDIKTETLLLYGSEDIACPPMEGAMIFKLIGDKAQFRVFQDCGHFSPEDYTEEFVDLITRYVLNKF